MVSKGIGSICDRIGESMRQRNAQAQEVAHYTDKVGKLQVCETLI